MEADSNRGRTDSPTLKNCIDDLKKLAIKAENVLENYSFEVESKKEGKGLKKKLQRFMGILCDCYSVHQVGDEIDDIRSRLANITGSLRSIFGGEEAGSSSSAYQEQRGRIRYAHEEDQHFVGMEKDIHSVVLMVNYTESSLVISICGMGGLGKTTLARKIYNHPDVKGSFNGRAWVCVTQQFQAENILSSNGCQLPAIQLTVECCDLRNVLEKMLMSHSLLYLRILIKCEIGCGFPSYKQGMCRNLVKLIIANCEIEGDAVEVLGKYPMLRFLWLEGRLGEVGKNSEMRFGPNSFPELKLLTLDNVWNLRKWEVEKGAMIKLRDLIIEKCRNLEKLPDGLRFISTLESVTCYDMSKEFKDRMRKDYANFSHIHFLEVD